VVITASTRNCPKLLEVVGTQFSANPVTVRLQQSVLTEQKIFSNEISNKIKYLL